MTTDLPAPVATTDRSLRARGLAGPALLALLSAVSFVAVFLLAVNSALGQRVENRSLEAADPRGSTYLLGLVSVPNLGFALLVVVVIALVRRSPAVAARVFVVVALANVAGQLLKYHVLSRPALTDLTSINTFPSGHTIVFTSVSLGLLMAAPAVLRPAIALVAAGVVGFAVWEILQFGWHRPSDVIGGLLLVAFVAAATVFVSGRQGRIPTRRSVKVVVVILVALAVLALLAAVAVGVLLLVQGRPLDQHLLLRGGQLGSVAVTCLVLAIGTWLPPD